MRGEFKQEYLKNCCFRLIFINFAENTNVFQDWFAAKKKNPMTEHLDKTDILILKALQENGRITVKDLALKVHLSTTPVFDRMRRLEKEGYIQRYTAVLSPAKLGRGFTVFCSVRLRRMGKEIAHDFVARIKDIPEVAECYNISGDFDYLLKIYAPDMKYYNEFIINILGTIDSLGSIQSWFVMDEIKNSYGLPVSLI